jgi:hypothetical protein
MPLNEGSNSRIVVPNPTTLLLARLFAAAEMDYIAAAARRIELGQQF